MDIRKFFSKSPKDLNDDNRNFKDKPKNIIRKRARAKGVLFDSDSSDEDVKQSKVKNRLNSSDIISNSDDDSSLASSRKKKKPIAKKISKETDKSTLQSTTPSDFFGSFKADASKTRVKKRKATASNVQSNEPKSLKKDEKCIIIDDLLDDEVPTTVLKTKQGTVSSKLAANERASSRNAHKRKSESSVKSDEKGEDRSTKNVHPSKQALSEKASENVGTGKAKIVCKENKANSDFQAAADKPKPIKDKLKHEYTPQKKPLPDSQPQSSAKKEQFLKYQQWKNRAGPSAPGSKEIPQGAENCFEGFTFVITGVQESLTRDEITSLIERYGGKVTSGVSGRTSYLITGEDAGQTKLQKAEKLKTKIINEDGLLDLIRTTPGKKSKYEINEEPKSATSPVSSTAVHSAKGKVDKTASAKQCSSSCALDSIKTEPSPPSSSKVCSGTKEQSTIKKVSATKKDVSMMWVDKYKPSSIKQIIGQQGAKSNVHKLLNWLQNWHANNRTAAGRNKPKPRVTPWGGGDPTGASFKAALLSGPPGVGKTTSATLVCKELGYSYVELNASDTRSKKTLKEDVADSVQNTSIVNLFGSKLHSPSSNNETRNVLLMDEVDGMAGNEDRGGMQELIQVIKSTKIPIICMCNDRSSPKMRSLTNHCFDLRFQRPRVEQITGSAMNICYKEGLKVQAPAVQAIIKGCNQDVRQVLHNLNMLKANSDSLSYDDAKVHSEKTQKDVTLGIFEIARKLLSSESASMSLHDKSNLFFMDYSMVPKFVQENYLHVSSFAAKGDMGAQLELISKAADSIAAGDLIESAIRHDQSWSMLPTLGLMSTVLPCDFMRGGMQGMINFPSFFGKLSTTGKNHRLFQELKFHSSLATGGSTGDTFTLDLLPYLRWLLSQPLVKQSQTGESEVSTVTKLLSDYDFVREDYDNLMEVGQFEGKINYMSKVDSKVKAAFTRTFNKESHRIPYAVMSAAAVKKSRKAAGDVSEMDDNDESQTVAESDEDDIEMDGMIKQAKKKAPAAKSKSKKSNEKPRQSKKGKGRKK